MCLKVAKSVSQCQTLQGHIFQFWYNFHLLMDLIKQHLWLNWHVSWYDITFLWAWPTCWFPILKKEKKMSDATAMRWLLLRSQALDTKSVYDIIYIAYILYKEYIDYIITYIEFVSSACGYIMYTIHVSKSVVCDWITYKSSIV